MTPLQILILEDDLILAQDLQEQLEELGYYICINTDQAEQALYAFMEEKPDLAILDIALDNSRVDGIQVASAFNRFRKIPIIYLSALTDPIIQQRARATNPAAYLLKPHQPQQLAIALEIALDNFVHCREASLAISPLLTERPQKPFFSQKEYFFTRKRDRFIKIKISEILWVKAISGSVEIVLPNEKVIVCANLKSFALQIQHSTLLRVHRSYIINLDKVSALAENCLYIPYRNQQERIPISQKYRKTLMKHIPRLMAD